ncbi:ATP-binding protein [Thermonema rossianum]|jgi:serine/threonine-protein kinase RsbW|uniref:ATP-binding protein n=1 Tax=Thermonema rossianum TaxID=55505 RepID=UPI00056FBA6E|nr:ATP-binding protein [Thermonema rossianum]
MRLNLHIPYDSRYLSDLRRFVWRALRPLELSEITLNQLVLAVDEVCSNLIIHVPAAATDRIAVEIIVQDEWLTIEIVDTSGRSTFDMKEYVPPRIQALIRSRRKGGLGLRLVRSIMDKVDVFEREGCRVWRLQKALVSEKAS